MDNNYLLLLCFDALLHELDENYESPPEEQIQLVVSKVYESYGLTVTSSKEDLIKINTLLVQDLRKFREQIIKEIVTA